MKRTVVVVLALTVAACGSALYGNRVDPANYQAVKSSIAIENDPHRNLTITRTNIAYLDGLSSYLLRGWNNGQAHLYLSLNESDWRYYGSAASFGRELSVTQISSEVGSCSQYGCNVWETAGINLSEDDIKRFSNDGLAFRLYGQGGQRDIVVPAAFFAAFRDAWVAR
jgi:hypothetical protein